MGFPKSGKVKVNVPLDNLNHDGDLCSAELDADLEVACAAAGGKGAAKPVRDAMTGKLIRVELTLPVTANQGCG